MGGSPGLVVMGDDSCSKGNGFKSRCRILDGHFFTLICCKNCIFCLKRSKINEKEAGVGPFKKRVDVIESFIQSQLNKIRWIHSELQTTRQGIQRKVLRLLPGFTSKPLPV